MLISGKVVAKVLAWTDPRAGLCDRKAERIVRLEPMNPVVQVLRYRPQPS
jgi:hypothetical protein